LKEKLYEEQEELVDNMGQNYIAIDFKDIQILMLNVNNEKINFP
jgi:hypothetical protein